MIIIAVISPIGGSGKSSLALGLASILANLQHPVVLVEADPANLLVYQLGKPELTQQGLAQGLTNNTSWAHLITTLEDNVRFIPFGAQSFQESMDLSLQFAHNPKALETVIHGCATSDQDIFIFDTAKLPNFLAHAVLKISDLNLIPLTPDAHSLLSIDPTIQCLLEGRGSSYFLLNRFKANQALHLDIWTLAKIKLSHRLLPFYLVEDQALPEAFASGLSLQDYSPSSQLTQGFHQLANWIDQELHSYA